jgi:hypothetical protein
MDAHLPSKKVAIVKRHITKATWHCKKKKKKADCLHPSTSKYNKNGVTDAKQTFN